MSTWRSPTWVVDKSAIGRLRASPDVDEWLSRVDRGLVSLTTATLLEVGYSARSGADWSETVMAGLLATMPIAYLTPAAEKRAVELQGIMARRGTHRAPSVPDLLVAAVAESVGATVLHVDKDFDLISQITGQPVERLRL